MKRSNYLNTFLVASFSLSVLAAPPTDLLLEDPEDIKLLMDEFPEESKASPDMQVKDDLDILKDDIGDLEFSLPEEDLELVKQVEKIEEIKKKKEKKEGLVQINKASNAKEAALIFDVGREEKDLLEIADKMQGQIPDSDWNDIAAKSASGTYEVVRGDWLWKISQNIFGSGFYYPKIWALNAYITNPHEIEPGMILSFSTGSDKSLPSISIAKDIRKIKAREKIYDEYDEFGDEARPDWISERSRLKKQGVYLQYSSADTVGDLKDLGSLSTNKEYEIYEPPRLDFEILSPDDDFDSSGFDKNANVNLNFKEGFYLTTFISNNLVQDFGKVEAAIAEKTIFTAHDKIYIRFDEKINIVPGDKFSTYSAGGKVKNKNSDRAGFKYSITSTIEVINKSEDNLWECKIIENSGLISRGDRVTVYTPKIDRITKTYNSRLIESVIIGAYHKLQEYTSFGDVVYLDRGRADGVEVGNIFEVYGFKDRSTGENITDNPTYKNGEITVITVSDNFSTGLVSSSLRDFIVGDIAVTKTKEAAARATRIKQNLDAKDAKRLNEKALDELDVDLNLDDLNDSLLDKADKIQFTEDELAELERQEREKSIITENEKDLMALERLESEIETAEKMLNEARLDEDKLLEGKSLDKIEKELGYAQQESLDEVEENFGKRYLDEDLNDKENPYGLTEFDIEEVDELLNIEKESSSD